MRPAVERAMAVCPVEVAVAVLGGTWKLTLVKHLLERTHRFNELSRKVPLINVKTLARQLRELEEDGIVNRLAHPVIPPKVEYSLTERGRSLATLVEYMDEWGSSYKQQARTCETTRDFQGHYAG